MKEWFKTHRVPRSAALFVPLLLVNSAATYGQAGWAYDHLRMGWVVAILFAAAVESIGIYLAAEAHAALMAGDASVRLRLGSYAIGLLAGFLNYAHFASSDFAPNAVAIAFGVLSSISPWLWAIRSRSLNRDRLRELGQIDPRAVRFSILRWVFFPGLTFRTFKYALWHGIVQPAEAIDAAVRFGLPEEIAELVPAPITVDPEPTPAKPSKPNARGRETAKKIAAHVKRNPTAKPAEIAARIGVTEDTVRRHLPSTPTTEPTPVSA